MNSKQFTYNMAPEVYQYQQLMLLLLAQMKTIEKHEG